jgi:hypothetical protein
VKRKAKAGPGRVATPAPAIPAPTAPPVAVAAIVAPHEPWYLSIFTDRNREFDTGRLLVNVVILTMCAVALMTADETFNYQAFGIGIGSVLTGFAAYLFGDAQRPPAPAPSTITEVKQTQVTTP